MTSDATDDDLRRRYRDGAPAEGEHVDDPTWERFACGDLDAAERVHVSDHIASCAECGVIYRALTDLREEAPRFDPGAPAPDRREPRPWLASWRPALAIAAVLALVVASTIYRRETPSIVRSGGPAVQVSALAPSGTVSAKPPPAFQWAAVTGADHYRVQLHAADGPLLWTSADLAATSAAWPPSVPAAPGTYFWQVIALREGEEAGESPLTRVTLSAR